MKTFLNRLWSAILPPVTEDRTDLAASLAVAHAAAVKRVRESADNAEAVFGEMLDKYDSVRKGKK